MAWYGGKQMSPVSPVFYTVETVRFTLSFNQSKFTHSRELMSKSSHT